MFAFEWPWMIVLLPVPLLARAIMRPRKIVPADAPEIAFPYIERLKTVFPKYKGGGQKPDQFFIITLSLAWLCLTGALMQPEMLDQYTQVRNKGYDLMLAVDLSGSMRALDFATAGKMTTRLDVVKDVASQFIEERKGDRIGLVLFGSKAYQHVPLTFDTDSVAKMLNNTVVGEAGDATAIGDAIGMAVSNLRDRPEHSRVVVLLTDGGDNASTLPPMQAAKLAAQYGIRIYTIGIGSKGNVPIQDNFGRIIYAQFDLDEHLLKDIADATGGSYFPATDTKALESIYEEINKLEKTEAETRGYMIRNPLYRWPLGTALALFLLFSMMPLYRRTYHGT